MRGVTLTITKLAGVAAAVAVAFGIGAANVTPASAADNIKTFGEQERLNGPNGYPYIGYTVNKLAPSTDPVPHNGTLYAATLIVDGFSSNTPPLIERFGARTQSGYFYPSIWGASNTGKLYFDVVGEVPNSVVWNDGIRDILAWVPGETPLEPSSVGPGPDFASSGSESVVTAPESVPAETSPAIVATPNDLAAPPFQLTEGDVAQPGFNAGGGHR